MRAQTAAQTGDFYNQIHLLPGRMRVRVVGLHRNRPLAQRIVGAFRGSPGILLCQAEPRTGRVLILFDTARINPRQLISELGLLSTEITTLPQVKDNHCPLEPEDLPLGGQIFQIALAGTAFVFLSVKNSFGGRSPWASSTRLFNLAALTTIISAYPTFRSGVEHLTANRRLNHDLMLGLTMLTLLVARESLSGLLISLLINITTLLETLTVNSVRRTIRESVTPVPLVAAQAANLTKYRSRLAGPAYPARHGGWTKAPAASDSCLPKAAVNIHPVEKFSRQMLFLSGGLSILILLFTRDVSRPLALILAAAPSTLGVAAPSALGAGVAVAARRGILVRDARRLALAGQIDTLVFDNNTALIGGQFGPEVVETLKQVGVRRIVLLSSENAQNTEVAANTLGIEEFYSELSPSAKSSVIHHLQDQDKCICMVGDGINDTRAMIVAQVGIFLGQPRPDSSAWVADIIITGDDPAKVAYTLTLGKQVNTVLQQNYAMGALTNVCGLALAFFGVLTPLTAGLLTTGATLITMMSSLRILERERGTSWLQFTELAGSLALDIMQPTGLLPLVPSCQAVHWQQAGVVEQEAFGDSALEDGENPLLIEQ